MNFQILISVLIISFGALSCKTTKKTFDPKVEKYISFGNGGGFTGKVKQYYIKPDGHVFQKADTGYVYLTKLKKNKADQIFANYTTLSLDKKILNNPGNMYYFIEHNKMDEYGPQKLTWGAKDLDDKNIETYYQILINSIKDNTNK